jgi:hypothetical protein
MGRKVQTVPFGYEPPPSGNRRGTLIYYDTFEETAEEALDAAAELAKQRDFKQLVLYPLHEETFRRMSKMPISAYYKREDRLHEWKRNSACAAKANAAIEGWEGKRKKYTPIDAALRHLSEKYEGPHMLFVSAETANLFASFSSFEEWITRIRLLLSSEPSAVHPRLEKHWNRCEVASLPT